MLDQNLVNHIFDKLIEAKYKTDMGKSKKKIVFAYYDKHYNELLKAVTIFNSSYSCLLLNVANQFDCSNYSCSECANKAILAIMNNINKDRDIVYKEEE